MNFPSLGHSLQWNIPPSCYRDLNYEASLPFLLSSVSLFTGTALGIMNASNILWGTARGGYRIKLFISQGIDPDKAQTGFFTAALPNITAFQLRTIFPCSSPLDNHSRWICRLSTSVLLSICHAVDSPR